MPPSLPPDEAARLEALARYDLLDTAPEASFERVTALAARLFAVPVALITLIDGGRQWFKSCVGLDFEQTSRADSFCAYTILDKTVMVVPDTHLDPRFQANPYVVGAPFARFYVGAPLVTTDGFCLGSLCLLDKVPRSFDEAQCATLQDLAAVVVEAFEARRIAHQTESRRRAAELAASERRQASVVNSAFDGIIIFDQEGVILEFNPAAEKMFGYPRTEVVGRPMGEVLLPPDLRSTHLDRLRSITAAADAGILLERIEQWGWHARGHRFPAEISAVRSPGVEPPQYVGFVRDITERREAEAALRRQQEILEETGRIAQVGGWEYEVATGRSTWTPEIHRIYDLEPGEPPALAQILSWFLPSSRERLEAALHGAVERGTPYELELELVTAKRNCKWVRVICYPAFEDGRVTKLRGAIQDVTERRQALESLELFRSLMDNAADTVEVIDPATGRFLDVNAHGPKSLGYNREEYLTLCVGNVDPHLAGEAWTEQAERIRVAGMVSGEGQHRRKDGTLFPIEYKSQWVHLGRAYIVASVRDITERKAAQEALARSEANYRLFFDHNPLPTWVVDVASRRFLTVNQAAIDHYGYGREEFLNMSLADIHPPEQVSAMLANMNRVAPGHVQRNIYLHRKKDGTIIEVEAANVGIDYAGNLTSLAVSQDVTEQHRMERELRESEARFQRIVANVPGMVFRRVLHPDGSVSLPFISEASREIIGLEPEQLQRESLLNLSMCPPEDARDYYDCLTKSALSLQPFVWQGSVARHDTGKMRRIQVAARPEKMPDGDVIWDGVAMDVTERYEAEEQRRAKEEAERANAAKSEFLSRMSHELRTPLNAILGFGQVLQMSRLPEQETTALRYIMQAGHHLLGLVDEVLDLSRLETGKLNLASSDVRLDAVLRECLGLVANLGCKRGIVWRTDVKSLRVVVRCDEQRLRQVLLNLLSNAVKYNREGGKVRLAGEQLPNGRFRLKISDSGEGMSSQEIERLFVPFERLRHVSGPIEGTGLGLAISKQLAEAMGGGVGVTSQVGEGSTFWLDLPLVAAAPAVSRGRQKRTAKSQRQPSERKTLLYVEDSPSNLAVVEMLLNRHCPNWRLRSARTGHQGLESIRESLPDMVLLDLQLPGMKGDEVLAALRADPRTAALPVIMLSADATTHSREKLLKLGANEYLSKPLDVQRLLEVLDDNKG